MAAAVGAHSIFTTRSSPSTTAGRSDGRTMAHGEFETTQWSVVLSAGDRCEPAGREALAKPRDDDWYPVVCRNRIGGYLA